MIEESGIPSVEVKFYLPLSYSSELVLDAVPGLNLGTASKTASLEFHSPLSNSRLAVLEAVPRLSPGLSHPT